MPWHRILSFSLCTYALVGALVSFSGWAADVPRLADWSGGGITIQPNASIAVFGASLATLLLSRRLRYVTLALGVFVLLIGATSLFQIATDIDLGINTLFMFDREWGREGVIAPGRMGTPGATSWTLVGTAISLISMGAIFQKAEIVSKLRLLAVGLALTTLMVSSLSITGYLFGAEVLHALPRLTVIALQTATFIFAVSLALILRVADAGPMRILGDRSATGQMFRRIVPAIVAIPILLGSFQLLGESAGLYDRSFGIAAATLTEVVLLLGLLWWTGRTTADAEARRTATFETALDCIISIDQKGNVIEFNPAAELTFGYGRAEVMGRELAELIIPPSMREQHRKGLARYLATGEGRVLDRRIEMTALRADGAEFPVELSITRIGVIGAPQFTAYVRDITERKAAESAMRDARDILEARVVERTAELQRLNEALERSNQDLEQFASVASHDLQEPLRKIQAFGDRLQTKYAPELGEQGQDYLARMLIATTRMRSLIEGLLSFSRVTTKARAFVPVDLASAARDAAAILEGRIHAAGAEVRIGNLPVIEADPLQMEQLFLNLIGNAIKFHKPDARPIISVEGGIPDGSKGRFCEIMVRDNGIGFEPEYGERIFEVFERLHGRHEFEGTGMGLAICRKIAERHGGTLMASSEPGQGSTFRILLPKKQEK